MVLRVTATYSVLSGRVPLHLYAAVQKALTYTKQVQAFERGRGRVWQSQPVALYTATAQGLVFPSGLAHHVTAHIGPLDVQADEGGPATDPPPVTLLADGTQLYDDQAEAVTTALQCRRGLLALATNAGKTEVMASLLCSVPQASALVLVNQRGLLQQTVDRLRRLTGEPISVWGGGVRRYQPESRIWVATIQAVHRGLRRPGVRDWLNHVQLLLVDEADVISPTGWYPTLEACTRAWLRIGLSGTLREARHLLPIEAFFGPIIYDITDPELVAQGRSAATTVLMPWVGQQVPDGTDYDGEHGLYERGVVRHQARNQLVAEFAAQAAQQGLAVVVSFYRLPHGQTLEYLCRERYLGPVVRLDGQSAASLVEQVKTTAGAGQAGIYLTGVGYNRGLNMPGVRVLVNAAGWKSPQATSQRGGRVVRRKPDGGNWALIVDPYDLGNSTLKRHAQARERVYQRKGFRVLRGAPSALQETLRSLVAIPT